ncbi:glycosyltransferase family 39 protein [Antrihabitans sp. YC3-6]|uniref:Glycosyltransferase family 39 protein n=1 Tax=Antrihabitans stalagmiti TaxID=2799499 RepID=A0A934NS13_9NOCA|nr:glycosyltransferase family 39 protein [Antrihabitans stalagmiti]MBJ8340371.1 glycosyltransferase family 39 protein [Antrihabitans stalagmiti]
MTTSVASSPTNVGKRWERWALAALLLATLIAYVWGLGAAGWANSFYSAAAQAGSVSWKAFLFGSSDAANSITVDKPPASLWLMALSIRIFGLSSWSILVPQALLGVASVALLWATVRKYFGAAAGLLAGLVLAVTPVAVLMFRFNNPDALLVFLMIAAVWALLRGVEDGRMRWLVATGVLVGLGFLTKQLAVMLVVPPLALTYLLAGPPRLGKRIVQLLAAGAALVATAGSWLLLVELWPASSRPWIGGSQNNSIVELTLGYNGLGRIDGNERGSVGGGPVGGQFAEEFAEHGGGKMWGSSGLTRMFDPAQGGQIAWLLPAALLLLVVGIALRGRAARMDPQRASFIVWGGWLVVTGGVFSYMAGIFHSYYTVALAPAVAALVGSGAVVAWRSHEKIWVRTALGIVVVATAVTAWILLGRTEDFVPWLRWAIAATAIVATVALLVPIALSRRFAVVGVVAALFVALAGPAAYAAETISRPRVGSLVSAGPTPSGGDMFGGRHRGQGQGDAGQLGGGIPEWLANAVEAMGGGPGGGLLKGSTPGPEVVELLERGAESYTWMAATIGANSAAGYQLATGFPVMPIGGFNGTDPSPTLQQFERDVTDGKVHYFIASGMERMRGSGSGGSALISDWVESNFASAQVDGVTVYDLTKPKAGS